MLGRVAKPRPISTFCWLPPDSEVILSPRVPNLMSRSSACLPKMAPSVFQSMKPPRPFARKSGMTMFSKIDSEAKMPSRLRSPET